MQKENEKAAVVARLRGRLAEAVKRMANGGSMPLTPKMQSRMTQEVLADAAQRRTQLGGQNRSAMRAVPSEGLADFGQVVSHVLPSIGGALESIGSGRRLELPDYAGAAVEGAAMALPYGRMAKGVGRLADSAVEGYSLAGRPAVENALYHPLGFSGYPAGYTGKPWAVRNVFSRGELENMHETGLMLPKEAAPGAKAPKQKKYFSMADKTEGYNAPMLRIPSNKVPVGKAVVTRDVELLNKSTGEYQPFVGADFTAMGYARGGRIAQRSLMPAVQSESNLPQKGPR